MEPYDGSTMSANFLSTFQQHRGGKSTADIRTPDTSFIVDSGYLTTSNNTPNISSFSSTTTTSLSSTSIASEISTPQRSSAKSNNSNLHTISEYGESVVESIKLTPVTENIRNICNFHITTPKEQILPGAKRAVATVLNFQDFQSTPKKARVEETTCAPKVQGCSYSSSTTPRKVTKFRSKKQSFRKKLKSAPDLDVYFSENYNENEQSPRRTNISPIFDKNPVRGNRTPLSSSSSNLLRASTPKSSNYGGLYDTKPASVKKLLTFSDSQFKQLLRADEKEDLLSTSTLKKTPPAADARIAATSTSTTSTKKCLTESFVRVSDSNSSVVQQEDNDNDIESSIRPLSFNTTTYSGPQYNISAEEASHNYKKIYSVTSTVLRDRELSRRLLSSSAKLSSQKLLTKRIHIQSTGKRSLSQSISENISALTGAGTAITVTKTTKKEKTETESQGFQDILHINYDCHDMEISAIDEDQSSQNVIESVDARNYNIDSNVDLRLNDSIVCEAGTPPPIGVAVSSKPSEVASIRRAATTSRIPIPCTPRKTRPTSVDHERLEILYPMIRRTPSKYNPLNKRGANKRKYICDFSRTTKRPCQYYGGNTHLNIIAKLEKYPHILDEIFRCLLAPDLAAMLEVSRSWRQAIQANRRAWQRVKHYLSNCKALKENDKQVKIATENAFAKAQDYISPVDDNTSYKKIPFNQSNYRIDRKRAIGQNRSPPVSPSKRKFHENQKVVRTLAPNEKLLKCPRCNKSSRIFNALKLATNHHKIINNKSGTSTNRSSHVRSLSETFQSIATTPASGCFSVGRFEWPKCPTNNEDLSRTTSKFSPFPSLVTGSHGIIDRHPRTRFEMSLSFSSGTTTLSQDETAAYAECSGLSCGYRFCLECLSDYHPGTECKLFGPSSPSKDDGSGESIYSTGLASVRNGKNMRRKMLKRLCF